MKKMITLFASVLLVTTAFAQFAQGNNNDKQRNAVYRNWNAGNSRYDNDHYSFSRKEMDKQVDKINKKYDKKIAAVSHKLFMGRSKKEAQIRSLEEQRRNELKMVYAKFNNRDNHWDGR